MPTYEYQCKECKKKFVLVQSLQQKKRTKCPKCKSGRVKQLISAFTSQTSTKS